MQTMIRLGVLTPSSNTVLEPMTSAIAAAMPGCSAHFSRFKVTQIALSAQALGQFDDANILAAADLLADAKVDAIGWSGTAAGWLGFEKDALLAERIQVRTGIASTTAILALNELLAIGQVKRMAVVSPYTPDVQERIIANYAAAGIEVVANTYENISDNHAFGLLTPELLWQRMEQTLAAKPQAIVTYCTNLRAAQLAAQFEQQYGVPVLDTVSTTVWGMLRAAGADPKAVRNWGQLFDWH